MTDTPAHVDQHDATPEPHPEATGSRRNLLKLAAGAAAGGTAVALAASEGSASAADDGNLIIGTSNSQGDVGRRSTALVYENAESPNTTLGPLNIMTVRDTNPIPLGFDSSTAYQSAIGGWANRVVANGVYGRTRIGGGYGVVAHGLTGGISAPPTTGLLARGTRANVEMHNFGAPPPERTDEHSTGELIVDENGDLWYCGEGGTPGTWVQLNAAAPPAVLNYTPVTPFRVYDSRQETDGAFTGGENRTISVADSRDVETYAVVTADAVPPSATAVTGNVVAIQTTDTGFLSINPGGTTAITAATVNWASGMNIGNAGTFALNGSRELEAVFGPGNGAHMTIDITGYYT